METRVSTLFVDTGQVTWTVSIAVAANYMALVSWISYIAITATTLCNVVVREALGVDSATFGREQTRIHAVVVDARLVWHALRVSLTLH